MGRSPIIILQGFNWNAKVTKVLSGMTLLGTVMNDKGVKIYGKNIK